MWNEGDKVAFRASNDSGSSFGDKIILGRGVEEEEGYVEKQLEKF
jgi:hypothetical protein